MSLPTDPKARKDLPLFEGTFGYFPDALAEVARVSKVGNDQHNPGQPLHWARGKSTDQLDSAMRHIVDNKRDPIDTDGTRHLAKAIWRLCAELQLQLEAEQLIAVPAVPGGVVPDVNFPEPAQGTAYRVERVMPPLAEDAAYLVRKALAGAGPIGRRPSFRDYGIADGTDF